MYAMPLLDGAATRVGIAALLLGSDHALPSHDARVLLQAHADQAGQALGRISRHQQEHDIAVLLQNSLLPSELRPGEGVAVEAHYQAGVDYAAVGGDWFDVVRRPDGLTHLTVGDVAGKGIEAAISMGQLRNAFRAYALDHESPADIIERMRRHVRDGEMATMVCATYDPLTGALAYASAGHPPPLLVDATNDEVVQLDGARARPLGWRQQHAVGDAQALVTDASALALYTDGLVERRGSSLNEDIDRLADVLPDVLGRDGNVAGTIVQRMLGSVGEDDVALMLATFEVVPGTVHVDIPAEALAIRALRPRVRRWLEARGMHESAREATVLALCEACNNAVEHGYRDGTGRIRIRLEHVDDKVTVRVTDDGTWREPFADPTRGRGFMLMRGLTDYTNVIRGADGTEVLLEKTLVVSRGGEKSKLPIPVLDDGVEH
jgi:anti-sigma regulatory factor (Ser/Thr protein kinase)